MVLSSSVILPLLHGFSVPCLGCWVLFSFQIYWRGWRIKGWEWLRPCSKLRIVTFNITGYQWDLFSTAVLILLVPQCWCPGVEPVLQFAFCLYSLNRKKFCLFKTFLLACLHPWLHMRRNKPAIFIICPKWQKFPLQISFYYICPRVMLCLYQGNTTC